VVGVEQWAELRREHFVAGKSIKRLVMETGLSRNTIRRALRSQTPPSYQRAPRPRVLDPFKEEIHRLLREDPRFGRPCSRAARAVWLHGLQDGRG
jgi:transposase